MSRLEKDLIQNENKGIMFDGSKFAKDIIIDGNEIKKRMIDYGWSAMNSDVFVASMNAELKSILDSFQKLNSNENIKLQWEKTKKIWKLELILINPLYCDCHTNEKLRLLKSNEMLNLGGEYCLKLMIISMMDNLLSDYEFMGHSMVKNVYLKNKEKHLAKVISTISDMLLVDDNSLENLNNLFLGKNSSSGFIVRSGWVIPLKYLKALLDKNYLICNGKAEFCSWFICNFKKLDKKGKLISAKENYIQKQLSSDDASNKVRRKMEVLISDLK